MAVRAQWHDDLAAVADDDPFAGRSLRIEEVGKPIDVSGDDAQLNSALAGALKREGELFNLDVTCSLKDRSDSCCHACPVRSDDPLNPLTALCQVGLEQERLATALAARTERRRAASH